MTGKKRLIMEKNDKMRKKSPPSFGEGGGRGFKVPTAQEWSAFLVLLAGIVVAFIAVLTEPVGELSESSLWLFAQCLVYAGSIFGVKVYIEKEVARLAK